MSRRRLLGAALAAPAAVALPVVAAPSPDAALLADCARWHELHAIMCDPTHPDYEVECDDLPYWPEFLEVEGRIETATSVTADGIKAMCRVAIADDPDLRRAAKGEGWNDDTSMRIARQLLLMFGGAL